MELTVVDLHDMQTSKSVLFAVMSNT